MSVTIDRQGNLHDAVGQFTDKPQGAAGFDLDSTAGAAAEDEPTPGTTYSFPADRLVAAKASIEAANKRLAKAGIEEQFEYEVTEHVVTRSVGGVETSVPYVTVTLSTPEIAYGGYTFLAVVERAEAGLLVKSHPDAELDGWAPESMLCDHCGRDIARQKTYLLADADGKRVQVGSTCLAPYLGVKPSGLWLLDVDPLEDASTYDEDDYFGAGGRERQVDTVHDTLAVALAVSDMGRGFRSARDSGSSTAVQVDRVLHLGIRETDADRAWRAEMRARAQEVKAEGGVERVLADIEALDPSSDYARNLQVIARGEHVSARNTNMLVSALRTYQIARQKEAERAAFSPGHMAPQGAKVAGAKVHVAKVRHITETDGYTGREVTRTQVVMQDEQGHQVVWWASSKQDIEEGDTLTLTGGSVKKHGAYNGIDQTVLTRVKYVSAKAAAELAQAGVPDYRAAIIQRGSNLSGYQHRLLRAVEGTTSESELDLALGGARSEGIAKRDLDAAAKYIRSRWADGAQTDAESNREFHDLYDLPD